MTKILYIDSDDEMLSTMGQYLSWNGFMVTPEKDSLSGLALAEKGGYDLIICDIFTEPVDGYMLATRVRLSSEAGLRGQNMILVGGEEPAMDKQLLLKKLDVHFMNKHTGAGVWSEKIRIILQKRKR